MVERIFIAMALTITIPAFAQERVYDLSDFATPLSEVEDLEWRELSGASQNGKRPLTIEKINQLERRRKAPDRKTAYGLVRSTSRARDVNCMKAFSHARFCKCLGEKLAAFLSFEGYVAIVTGTKTQYFSGMKAQEKQTLFDLTIKVREQCVASSLDRQ